MAFGDNFDCAIDHFDGGLIVNRVRRHRLPGGPFFCVSHGIVRTLWVIQVRKQRKINQSQRSIVAMGRLLAGGSDRTNRRRPLRSWGSPPCSRRSPPHRPSRATTARGPPVPIAASSSTDTGNPRLKPAERQSPGPRDPILFLILGRAVSSSTPNDFHPNSHKGLRLLRG